MKPIAKVLVLLCLSLWSRAQYDKPYSNYVPPDHPLLNSQKKYDNPLHWNILYGLGGQLGVDWQKDGGAVYNKLYGYFTHKGFLVQASYSRDISGASIFSSTNPLMKTFNQPYRCSEISASIHLSDRIKHQTTLPYVGVLVLRDEKFIENVYKYEYLKKDKTGEIHHHYKEWKSFHTNQEISYRSAWGVGGSFISSRSNIIYSGKDETYKLNSVILTDANASPAYLIMPYNQSMAGIGIHLSTFYSYSYRYRLGDLPRLKFRGNIFSLTQIEFLLATNLDYSSTVATYQNSQVKMESVGEVKSNKFGFRLKRTTNAIRFSGIKPGLYAQAEAGLRPGIYSSAIPDGLYIAFGLGFIL